jgi:DNA-binding winged helix-turn-helix (wHTH) protein
MMMPALDARGPGKITSLSVARPDRDLIRTIAGRGYQFTGGIRVVSATEWCQELAF